MKLKTIRSNTTVLKIDFSISKTTVKINQRLKNREREFIFHYILSLYTFNYFFDITFSKGLMEYNFIQEFHLLTHFACNKTIDFNF